MSNMLEILASAEMDGPGDGPDVSTLVSADFERPAFFEAPHTEPLPTLPRIRRAPPARGAGW